MCWNKEVSLITYVTVVVIVIILYQRNVGSDRQLALFSLAFVTIQLLEFFAWISIENQNRKMNDLVTRLILIALWAQPLINSYLAYKVVSKEEPTETNKNFKWILTAMVIMFTIFFIYSIYMASSNKTKFSTTTGPNCHLVWKRGQGLDFMGEKLIILYLAGLIVPLLFVENFKKGLILITVGLVLMIFSRMMSSQKEMGSWWCWVAFVFVLAAWIYKYGPEYNKKNEEKDKEQTTSH
jgi:preprotein translocase subunit SecG